jgi:hypothetical protein
MAAVKSVGHQANRQFGELPFEPLAQTLETVEFAVLLFGLRVDHVHLLMHEGKGVPPGPATETWRT